METPTHAASPVALDRLVRRFAEMKEYLPQSRLSRWEAFRLMFGIHAPVKVWPATNAIWQLKDYGEKTRSRWVEEYRHQRKLSAITRGTDYETNDQVEQPGRERAPKHQTEI